jgi:hypothetical protein
METSVVRLTLLYICDFGHDLIQGSGPDKNAWVLVGGFDIIGDSLDQGRDIVEAAAANAFLRKQIFSWLCAWHHPKNLRESA